MRDEFRRKLRRAEAHQNFKRSPYTSYTEYAEEKLRDSPILLVVSSLFLYIAMLIKTIEAQKATKYEDHEDIESKLCDGMERLLDGR